MPIRDWNQIKGYLDNPNVSNDTKWNILRNWVNQHEDGDIPDEVRNYIVRYNPGGEEKDDIDDIDDLDTDDGDEYDGDDTSKNSDHTDSEIKNADDQIAKGDPNKEAFDKVK